MKYTEANVPENLRLRVRYVKGRQWVSKATLWDEEGYCVAEGVAKCSRRDIPSRKIGRAIAVGRALKEYHTLKDLSRYHALSA